MEIKRETDEPSWGESSKILASWSIWLFLELSPTWPQLRPKAGHLKITREERYGMKVGIKVFCPKLNKALRSIPAPCIGPGSKLGASADGTWQEWYGHMTDSIQLSGFSILYIKSFLDSFQGQLHIQPTAVKSNLDLARACTAVARSFWTT